MSDGDYNKKIQPLSKELIEQIKKLKAKIGNEDILRSIDKKAKGVKEAFTK